MRRNSRARPHYERLAEILSILPRSTARRLGKHIKAAGRPAMFVITVPTS